MLFFLPALRTDKQFNKVACGDLLWLSRVGIARLIVIFNIWLFKPSEWHICPQGPPCSSVGKESVELEGKGRRCLAENGANGTFLGLTDLSKATRIYFCVLSFLRNTQLKI